MPRLDWIGKDKVISHHLDVPFRPLIEDKTESHASTVLAGDGRESRDNRIIHGDNLDALKALMPEFEGKVDCIYIDPPYNTGNQTWIYNDNVDDPRIQKWLDKVVGNSRRDLCRTDKWLCMMYPRISLLHRLLSHDGVIIVHIDENECESLLMIMKEIFGADNHIGTMVWDKKNPKGDVGGVSYQHESILIFAKNKTSYLSTKKPERIKANASAILNKAKSIWSMIGTKIVPTDLLKVLKKYKLDCDYAKHKITVDAICARKMFLEWMSEQKGFSGGESAYKYLDDNGDVYQPVSMSWPNKEKAPKEYFEPLIHPITRRPCPVPARGWRNPPSTMQALVDGNQIVFGVDETTQPRRKYLLSEHITEGVPSILAFGGSDDALLGTLGISFENPKPFQMSSEIIRFFAKRDSVVLDSFGGSGTTAHAVLHANSVDGGTRRFILIEMMDHARTHVAKRARRVMDGYGEGAKAVAGTGGRFSFYELGEPLFDEDDEISPVADIEALRRYVAWTEGVPASGVAPWDPALGNVLLGSHAGKAVAFLYNPTKATTLDIDFIAVEALALRGMDESLVIYADRCALSPEFLRKHRIVFKKIPRDITRL